jgi:hypothetical protein
MSGIMCMLLGAGAPSVSSLSASNSPSSTYNLTFEAGTIVSNPVTCTAFNGAPPYSYNWSHVSGSVFTIDNPSNATTTFSTNLASVGIYSGVYRCTVTDTASGSVVATPDVTIVLERDFIF